MWASGIPSVASMDDQRRPQPDHLVQDNVEINKKEIVDNQFSPILETRFREGNQDLYNQPIAKIELPLEELGS